MNWTNSWSLWSQLLFIIMFATCSSLFVSSRSSRELFLFLPSSSIRKLSATQSRNLLYCLHNTLTSRETQTEKDLLAEWLCSIDSYLAYSFYPLLIPHSTNLKLYFIYILKGENLYNKKGKASIPNEFKMNPSKQKVNYAHHWQHFGLIIYSMYKTQ